MRILAANLKFFYQRRGIWLIYFFLLMFSSAFLMSVFSSKPNRRECIYIFNALMASLCFGVACASLWKDALGKAFSFCLPKSQGVPRRMIFLAGVGFNILLTLLFIHSRRLVPFMEALPMATPVFFIGMSFFLLGVLSIYQTTFQHIWRWIFILFPLMSFRIAVHYIEDFLVTHPLLFTSIGVGMCVFVWFRIGQKRLRRALCMTPSYSLFDSWNPTKVKRIREQWAARKTNHSVERCRERRERYFLAHMKQYGVLSTGRYAWGWLYRLFGNTGVKYVPGILVYVLLILLFAYMPSKPMQCWIIIMPAIFMSTSVPLPLKQSILLPAGRKELFRTVLVLLPVYTILAMVFITAGGLFWQGMYTFLPQVTFGDFTFTCGAFHWLDLLLIPMFFPLCFSVRRFFHREDGLGKILVMMIVFLIFVPIIAVFNVIVSLDSYWPFVLILAGVLWLLCFGAYRNYFHRANLTWLGRG